MSIQYSRHPYPVYHEGEWKVQTDDHGLVPMDGIDGPFTRRVDLETRWLFVLTLVIVAVVAVAAWL